MADGALREPQLAGRERHAAVAQRRVERNQAIKRGKGTHASTMKEIHGDVNNWRWRKAAIQDISSRHAGSLLAR
jgi:hypothetical protein